MSDDYEKFDHNPYFQYTNDDDSQEDNQDKKGKVIPTSEEIEEIIAAIINDDYQFVLDRIRDDLSFEYCNDDGIGILHSATMLEKLRFIELIVSSGACGVDVCDETNATALGAAAANGRVDSCVMLLSLGADPALKDFNDLTPFIYAIDSNSYEILEMFLAHCGYQILQQHCESFNMNPLFHAIRIGNIDMVRLFLKYDSSLLDVKEEGITALHYAASLKAYDIIDVLNEYLE